MRRVRILGALFAALTLTSVGAVSASAAPTDEFQPAGQLNTAAIPGFESPRKMVVNQQNGNILIYERSQIDQFGPNGDPVNFSGLGSPSISFGSGRPIELLVDNGAGPTQGNIYAVETSGGAWAGPSFYSFTPDGKPIPGTPAEVSAKLAAEITAGWVRPDGNLLIITTPFYSASNSASVWTPSGTQVGKPAGFEGNMPVCCGPPNQIFDKFGHLYGPGNEGEYWRFKPSGASFVLEGNTGMSAQFFDGPMATDPSNGDFLIRNGPEIKAIKYTDPLVKGSPFKLIAGLESVGEAFGLDGTGEYLYAGEGGGIVRVYHREPPKVPSVLGPVAVEGIRTSRADLHAELASNGADTTYYFEYGTDTNYGSVTPSGVTPRSFHPKVVSGTIEGLEPDTTYHLRVVATNSAGTTKGADRIIKTYPISTGGADDSCPNALARKQTSAQRLPDCRAYEFVSANDTAGYDVESYLVPGQEPFPGFPAAKDRLLYATHAGAVPGPWNATNKGRDPYLATRTVNGWVTDYKGLPADLKAASGSFASELGEADSTLDTFAFAGPELCSPCFESGLETGLPVRLPDGRLVQGMSGSLSPASNSARPEGKVAKFFSADGRYLVFASKYAFEPGANTDGTSLTVYVRDLVAGTTRIVSQDENGAVLSGAGISELDISADGSRVVVGKRVSTDSSGNEYVHPYMHVGSATKGVDLAPKSTSGVLYAGMTPDGSVAYFTTVDKLLADDEDSSADLYRAAVGPTGTLDLSLVTGNSVAPCNPVANGNGPHWNTTGAAANCDAVAIGGGGGVVSEDGSVYFLSPERFGGQGTANEPNLYLAVPGDTPELVATLEPGNPLVLDSVADSATRRTADFQVTADGAFAAFTSALPLTGTANFGFRSVFRYDAVAGQLACSSCDTTGSSDDTFAGNAALAPSGLSILEDGSVFFTTLFPLVLNDANGRSDVYQATPNGKQDLISSGTGSFDAGLLTVSADGTDAFFFTHDTLAPEEDENGQLMKVYDARVGGGFFKLPPAVPCKASDECHGPSSPVPPLPDIKSSGKSTVGNDLVCPKNKVKHRNQCIKKKKHKKAKKKKSGKAKKKGSRHA